MLDAIEGVSVHLATHDAASFARDRTATRAVERELAILGEAAKLVGQEVRERHPSVPWREMAGLRDVLVHDDFGVDLEVLASVVAEELPSLGRRLDEIVAAEGWADT